MGLAHPNNCVCHNSSVRGWEQHTTGQMGSCALLAGIGRNCLHAFSKSTWQNVFSYKNCLWYSHIPAWWLSFTLFATSTTRQIMSPYVQWRHILTYQSCTASLGRPHQTTHSLASFPGRRRNAFPAAWERTYGTRLQLAPERGFPNDTANENKGS